MAVAAAVLVFVQALAEISLPTLMASIVDIGVVQGDTGHILKVGGVMVIVAASGMIAAFFGARLASLVAVGICPGPAQQAVRPHLQLLAAGV